MKDESSSLHRQLGMQEQETLLIHTTGVSYTWQALWRKKQRTGSINYHTLCVVLTHEQLDQEECREGEDQQVGKVRNRREGVQIGLSINSGH